MTQRVPAHVAEVTGFCCFLCLCCSFAFTPPCAVDISFLIRKALVNPCCCSEIWFLVNFSPSSALAIWMGSVHYSSCSLMSLSLLPTLDFQAGYYSVMNSAAVGPWTTRHVGQFNCWLAWLFHPFPALYKAVIASFCREWFTAGFSIKSEVFLAVFCSSFTPPALTCVPVRSISISHTP